MADGLHARTDGFTSLAVAVGAIGVLAGFPLADPIVGLLITVAILVVLKGAATEVFRRLLVGVDPALVEQGERSLLATPGVTGVDAIQLRWIGHQLHAETSIEVDDTLTSGPPTRLPILPKTGFATTCRSLRAPRCTPVLRKASNRAPLVESPCCGWPGRAVFMRSAGSRTERVERWRQKLL